MKNGKKMKDDKKLTSLIKCMVFVASSPQFHMPWQQTVSNTHLRIQHTFLRITAHVFDDAKGMPQSMLLKFQPFHETHGSHCNS